MTDSAAFGGLSVRYATKGCCLFIQCCKMEFGVTELVAHFGPLTSRSARAFNTGWEADQLLTVGLVSKPPRPVLRAFFMSMDLMVKAMKARVGNPIKKLVLIKLADNANDNGQCWPSYQHVADQCEIDRSTVRRHIKSLADDGLLRLENRKGPKGNTSNMYWVLTEPVGTESTGVGAQKAQGVGTESTPPVGTESTRTSHSIEPVTESVIPSEKLTSSKTRKPSATVGPSNVSEEVWQGFVEHRKAIGKKMTDRAVKLLAGKVENLSQEQADECLNLSIENGWTGVFPEKVSRSTPKEPQKQQPWAGAI